MTLVERVPTSMPIPQPVSESAAIISMTERMARDPSVDIVKLQQIMQLRLEVEARENQRAFDAALTAAQAEMEPVRRDANNPQTKSRFATHYAVKNAIHPYCVTHGIGITFDTGTAAKPEDVRVIARVTCSGHRQEYHVDMPADGKGAKGGDVMTRTHATGSAMTYGRRYLLLMIFDIAVGEAADDDDGNAADGSEPRITEKQVEELQKLIIAAAPEGSTTAIKAFNDWAGVKQIADLAASKFAKAKAGLEQKIAKKAKP